MKKAMMLFNLMIFLNTSIAQASTLIQNDKIKSKRHFLAQIGYYFPSQGLSQHIPIKNLIGNQYTLTQHHPNNPLIGFGYFIDGPTKKHFQISYGINGFYLPHTSVNGHILVENFFNTLTYHYQIQHIPLYIAAKTLIKNNHQFYQITLDGGLGLNFMRAFNYQEKPFDSEALPQDNFISHTQESFSAMTGIGIRFNRVFGQAPLECGYRFFYLGQGNLKIHNTLYQNTLKAGNSYANALLCSISI